MTSRKIKKDRAKEKETTNRTITFVSAKFAIEINRRMCHDLSASRTSDTKSQLLCNIHALSHSAVHVQETHELRRRTQKKLQISCEYIAINRERQSNAIQKLIEIADENFTK